MSEDEFELPEIVVYSVPVELRSIPFGSMNKDVRVPNERVRKKADVWIVRRGDEVLKVFADEGDAVEYATGLSDSVGIYVWGKPK